MENLVLGPNDRLITADIKDSFVVGEHQYLAKMAPSILTAKDRHLVDGVILFFAPKPGRSKAQ